MTMVSPAPSSMRSWVGVMVNVALPLLRPLGMVRVTVVGLVTV